MAETPSTDTTRTADEPDTSLVVKEVHEKAKDSGAAPARSGTGLAMLCLFLLACAGGVGGWYGWHLWLQVQSLEQRLQGALSQQVEPFDPAPIERQLSQLHERYLALENPGEQAREEQSTQQALSHLARQLASLESRLAAVSGTSRSDWKLAEAAFLLRMANQKVLLEHNSQEALAMTRAADAILLAQNDPGLFAIRQVLAEEMSELKLAQTIDKEGVFLRLQSIIDQLDELPVLSSYERHLPNETAALVSAPEGLWGKVVHSVANAWRTLGSFIRVSHHDEPVEPLLAPEYEYFLKQNLRLMLSQAQQALLRESQVVYDESLNNAQQWLGTYFSQSEQAGVLVNELSELSEITVKANLPDIDKAHRLLGDYIERLHKVQPEDEA